MSIMSIVSIGKHVSNYELTWPGVTIRVMINRSVERTSKISTSNLGYCYILMFNRGHY